MKNVLKIISLLMCLLIALTEVFAESKKLEEGIWQYKHENYEEALVILKEAREEDPSSSITAYYLGLTYKQLQDYKKAKPELEAAVTLKPHIKGALIELIDLLYKSDNTKEAKKWIQVAEKENVRPAQTAFLKGMVLLKEGSDLDGAIASLEKAKELDETLTGAANYNIGMAHVKQKELEKAKTLFKGVVTRDPTTNLAQYADQYVELISERQEITKPLKLTFGGYYQYDDNVILLPGEESLASGISESGDGRQVYTLRADYNYKPLENFATRFGYSFYYAKQNDLGFYDTVGNYFTAQPSFYFEKAAVTFPVAFNYLMVNDKEYLANFSLGNLTNYMVTKNQMLQGAFIYNKKDYLWSVTQEAENRDSNELMGHLSYYYFFAKKKGFINLKHSMNYDDARGGNWKMFGNKTTATILIPILKKV